MTIPLEISTLINQLNQELERTEQEATAGLNLARAALSRFPDNALLIQFFASLSNILLFVETYKGIVQTTQQRISPADVTDSEIQEAGEDLATLLGRVLEVRINASSLKTFLENWL